MSDNPNIGNDSVKCEENCFVNPDLVKLFEQIWSPMTEIRAVVFIIHGLNEHSSFCYKDSVAIPLTKIGCMVVTHDHVGHGRSDGHRMIVGNVDNLARDVIVHIDNIFLRKSIPKDIPVFLYGHSLGGLIACIVSLERPKLIAGMVLESPAVGICDTAAKSRVTHVVTRILSVVIPSWVIRKPLFTNLSRNSTVVQCAKEDEYRNKDGLTWGTAMNLTNAVISLQPRLKEIQTPFFVAHGEKDTIVSASSSRLLVKEACAMDKSIHIYDGGLHLLREDSNNVGEDFTNRIVIWIDSHIK